jgi:hypothetical protein
MNKQIKYIIFSGPIGSGKTTQMYYLASKQKRFTVVDSLDPVNHKDFSICLKELGLPDAYAYYELRSDSENINTYEKLTKEHGVLVIILIPRLFEICEKRIIEEQRLGGRDKDQRGLCLYDFTQAIKTYRDFKYFTACVNLNIENVEITEEDSILSVNKKIESIMKKYGV